MSKEKQIEEMSCAICDECRAHTPSCECIMCDAAIESATDIYNAGYRKQSEGEWEKFEGERFICSNCAKVFGLGSTATIHDVKRVWNFCPNCGAKMKGGAE